MKSPADLQNIDFRAVFEASPSPFLLLLPDADFTIITANDAYCSATMRTRKELTGLPLFVAFPDNPNDPTADGVANLRRSLNRVLALKRPDRMAVQKYDIPRSVSDGGGFEERWWNPLNLPVLNGENEVRYIIHHVEDVTELVRLKRNAIEQGKLFEELQRSEGALRNSRTQLEFALKGRDELLSICSHELRTPVASMKLQTQMTKRNIAKGDRNALAPERMKKLVDQADRQLDRMTRLIEEMLDFSRIQGGRLKLQTEPFNLAILVTEVAERFLPQTEAVGSKLILEQLPETFGTWDRIRLEQVLSNLIGNAIKYAPGKPIIIQLNKSDSMALLSVTDQGPGIASENRLRIFEPYERAVSVNNISGLGLGLYISRQIVEAHDGRIYVQSARGGGSEFIVELPLPAAKRNTGAVHGQ